MTSWIRSKKQGFGKKNDEGFWYKPRGDWFSFAKVRNVGFLCSCKQTRETSISQRRTSFVIYSNGLNVWQSAEVRKKCLLDLKHGYVCYKNAWIRYRRPLFTLRSHVRHVLLRIRVLFFKMYSGLLTKSTPLPHCNAWRGQDNFLYKSDWIRLKGGSHIHLGCLEGEYITVHLMVLKWKYCKYTSGAL